MKVSPILLSLGAALAVFLLVPYLPSTLLRMTVGTRIGAAAVLIAVLGIAKQDMVLGLAAFLAAAALFLEQRRRVIERVQLRIAGSTKGEPGSVAGLDRPAPDLIPGERHPQFDEPEVQDHGYEPTEESGTNSFKVGGDSIDEKHPLSTVKPDPETVAELMQEKGLAPMNS